MCLMCFELVRTLKVGRQFNTLLRNVTIFVNWCALLFMMKFERDERNLYTHFYEHLQKASSIELIIFQIERINKLECSEQ